MNDSEPVQLSRDQAADVTAVLADFLHAARFGLLHSVGRGDRYRHAEIRQLHERAPEGRVELRPYQLYSIEVHADATGLARLVKVLKGPLAPFLDEEDGKVGFLQSERTLDDVAAGIVRAAAIATPEETVSALRRWLAGAPWITTRNLMLTGVSVEAPLQIGTGASLRPLPEQRHEMRRHAPSVLVDEVWRSGLRWAEFRGATVLCSEEYRRPVFWRPGQRPASDEELAFPGGWDGLFSLVRALALVCSARVETEYQWTGSTALQRAFATDRGEGFGGSPRSDGRSMIPRVPLTEPLVADALRVSKLLETAPEPVSALVNRVYSRWMNCMRERRPYDQLIEMRIALESLFAGTGRAEATLRVAYHGARYLGETPEGRRCLFKDLKTIYSTASTVVHGDTPKASRDVRALVERAQSICRDAMLRMLGDGEIPDWTELMLNGR